jgi:LysM repeat protein
MTKTITGTNTQTLSSNSAINDLWQQLHSDDYLNADNTSLSLPADNKLNSSDLNTLLADKTFFPDASLVMTLTSAKPPNSAGQIVLTGKITGTFLNLASPNATAIFTVDGSNNAQLAINADTIDNTTVLASAFSGLTDTDPGQVAFNGAVFTASSGASPSLNFSGTPISNQWILGLWAQGPGLMTGDINDWPADIPIFNLTTDIIPIVPTAGLQSMQAQMVLISESKASGNTVSATILGGINSGLSQQAVIPVSFELKKNYPSPPSFASADLDIAISSLSDLTGLFFNQQIATYVPNQYPIGNNFNLTKVKVGLNSDGSSSISDTATISVDTSIELLPLNLANLVGVDFTFTVYNDLTWEIIINGRFELANTSDLAFNGGLSFDSQSSTSNPITLYAANAKPIDVSTLINIIPLLPTLPESGLTIDTLETTIIPAQGTYQFNGQVTVPGDKWSIDLGRGLTLIELDQLSLSMLRTSTGTGVTIRAKTIFLSIPLSVSAATAPSSESWVFNGQLNSSKPLSLDTIAGQLLPFAAQAIPDIKLTALDCSFDTAANTFSVSTSLLWQLDIVPVSIAADLQLQSSRGNASDPAIYSGQVVGKLNINNLMLTVSYVFSPTTTDITFIYRDLKVVYHKDDTDPYVAISLDNSNVGELFIFLLSFAEPGKTISLPSPWDALEKISLPNLTVKVHLDSKLIEVDVDINLDLGFIKLENFTLSYVRQYGKAKFNLQLTCDFLGQEYGKDNNPLSWDPLNEQPPVVPGTGNETFDLEYLGIGQHLSFRSDIPNTMDGVIEELEKALVPIGNPTQNPANQLPGLTYDAGSNWLIGTRFTAMSTVALSVVFNDPKLYGLLIQLSGSKAGVLAGLRFEIMYRKISDSIGVYHIELTLPDAMRHIEMGAVSITLPVVTIDIYTNGNFKIDAGFPPSLTDFSRSFSAQVFPFIGYGGFYFAMLNGETASSVPQIGNGNFSPVLELGLALQVGVGKTLSLGILSGGISITVGGMLQGVLSWYNPSQKDQPSEMYFHIKGTLAVVGQVYATVNFGIIQASVSLTVYVSAEIDAESYKEIIISVSAGVKVKVSVKVLFIRIHFSFNTTITESFTIGSNRPTPWIIQTPAANDSIARSSYRSRNRVIRQRPFSLLRSRPARVMTNRGFISRYATANVDSSVIVEVTAIPLISKALSSDFSFAQGPTVPSGTANPVLSLMLGLETSTDPSNSTNQLMNFIIDWVADSLGHEHDTLSAAVVDEIIDALQLPETLDKQFSYSNVQQLFDSHNISFSITARPSDKLNDSDEIPMAIMAMIPELTLSAPDYSINFLTDRIPSAGYEARVQEYFADLSAQFAERQEALTSTLLSADTDSMAVFIFRYYFSMLTNGLMQQVKNSFAEMAWPLSSSQAATASLTAVANMLNNDYSARQGDTLATIASFFGLTEANLLAANPQYQITAPTIGQTVFIPAVSVVYTSQNGDTLIGLSDCFGVTTTALEAANLAISFDPLAAGTALQIPATRILHTAISGETASSIANDFSVDPALLVSANPSISFNSLVADTTLLIPAAVSTYAIAESNQNASGLLRSSVNLPLGDISFISQDSDTLTGLAAQFGLSEDAFVTTNQENLSLLQDNATLALGDLSTTIVTGESFNSLLAYWYNGNTETSAEDLLNANTSVIATSGQILTIPQVKTSDITIVVVDDETLTSILSSQKITIDVLMASNASILLSAGQAFVLPKVTSLISSSFILTYATATDDTLNAIAAVFFASAKSEQTKAVQSLQQWNGNIAADTLLSAGTVINIPYFSTIGNICRQYKLTVDQLCKNTDICSQEGLIAAKALVSAVNVQHVTDDNDTLMMIAQNYDLSLEQLTSRIEQVDGLFADNVGTINIKALPGLRLNVLNEQLATSGGYTNALNMATRFMLNGLRLPDPYFGGTPTTPSNSAYPLYALVGQEYPVASVSSDYTLTIESSKAQWVSVSDNKLEIPLLTQEVQRVNDFASTKLDQSGILSNALAIYSYVADRQTVPGTVLWATADMPPGLEVSGQKVSTPRVWTLPPAMVTALAESPTGTLPYQGVFGTANADGSITSTPLQATRYATSVNISLQLPPSGPDGSYLVTGADQGGMQRLLSLWSYMQTSGNSGATIYIAYTAQSSQTQSGAKTTDNLNRDKSFLVKTNLSTESHGSPQSSLFTTNTVMLNSGLVDESIATLAAADSSHFLQLLWECSVVKTGGYYFNYAKQDGTAGLPNTLFKDGQQADIQIMVVLDSQPSNDYMALAFNNILLVGDNVDTASHSLFFEAVTHTVAASDSLTSIASEYSGTVSLTAESLTEINQTIMGTLVPGLTIAGVTVNTNDTFLSVANRANISVTDLASQLATSTTALRTGGLLQIAGRPTQVVSASDTLATISAEYDFLDPAALASLNQNNAQLLIAGSTLTMPSGTATIGDNETFSQIAAQNKTDLSLIADLNSNADILSAGATILIAANTLQLVASLPPGHIGFDISRPNPEASDSSSETAQQALDNLFNLSGFNLTETATLNASNDGLPAGPVNDEDDALWNYRQIISIIAFVKTNNSIENPALPAAANNPYAAVGKQSTAQMDLTLLDIMGNQTDNSPLPSVTSDTGYTDELIALGAWPSATAAYTFIVPASDQKKNLNVDIVVSPTQFLPQSAAVDTLAGLPSADIASAASMRAFKALEQYQTIFYQLEQPDITSSLSTTLGTIEDNEYIGDTVHISLFGTAISAYVFLSQAQDLVVAPVPLGAQTSYTTLDSLLKGYPVSANSLGQLNAKVRADLLFGIGTELTTPYNVIAQSGDTAETIITQSQVTITLPILANQNANVLLSQDVMVKTASRTIKVPSALLSLSAVTLQALTSITDGPGDIPGLATTNAQVPLNSGITLVYDTYTYSDAKSLKDAADYFSQQAGQTVSVNDVAMANLYLDGIFSASQTLTLESVIAAETDSLQTIVNLYGAPTTTSDAPVEALLAANSAVPNLWPLGSALFIDNTTFIVAEGETLTEIAAVNGSSVGALVSANGCVALLDNSSLAIPYLADNSGIDVATYRANSQDTFASIASLFSNLSTYALLTQNNDIPGLFNPTNITIGSVSTTPTLSSTPDSLALALNVLLSDFSAHVATTIDLVRPYAVFITPAMQSQSNDTLADAANTFNIDAGALASACSTLPGLIAAGQTITIDGSDYATYDNDTIGMLGARINESRTRQQLSPISATSLANAADIKLLARTLLCPPQPASISVTVTPSYSQAITNLAVNLSTSRDPDMVAPGFTSAPRVISTSTAVPALPFSGLDDGDKQSLNQFAIDFETAFANLKVATGPKQVQGNAIIKKPSLKNAISTSSSNSKAKSLWVVNFSNTGQGFTYNIDQSSVRYFSIPPLSTTAWNGEVSVQTYTSTTGLSETGKATQFRSSDPDLWNQTFLGAVDLVLSPAYTVTGITDGDVAADIQAIIAAKKDIANGIADRVQPIVESENEGLQDAVQTMQQELLVELSTAYTVQSLVQLDLNVSGSGAGSDTKTAPQLSGKLVANVIVTPADGSGSSDPSEPLNPLAAQAQVTASFLASVIADMKNIIRPGLTIEKKSDNSKTYTTTSSDTLLIIADQFDLLPSQLAGGIALVDTSLPLFLGATAINVTATVAPGNLTTLTEVAEWGLIDFNDVLVANSERIEFFKTGSTITVGTTTYTPTARDTLAMIASHFNAEGAVTTAEQLDNFAIDLASIDAGSIPGTYTLNASAPPHGLQLVPQISLSTAKGALASTDSRITSVFGVKDPSVQKSVTLNLDYHVNQLEFDIHAVEGISGYLDSSWLSFIIPLEQATNTQGAVGQVQIPVPLRGYPEPAIISDQTASRPQRTADPAKVLAQWDYGFSAMRQFAAQDQMTLKVLFNQPDDYTSPSAAAGANHYEAVIEALANFSSVWPALSVDLALLPDAADGTVPAAAKTAMSALSKLVVDVQTAWNSLTTLMLASALPERSYIYQLSTLTKGQPAYISAVIMERIGQSLSFNTEPDDFIFTTDNSYAASLNQNIVPSALRDLFDGYGFILSENLDVTPKSEASTNDAWFIIDSQAKQRIADDLVLAPQTFFAQSDSSGSGTSNDTMNISRQILWPGLNIAADTDSKGQWIGGRQTGTQLTFEIPDETIYATQELILNFDFYRLNALILQNAWGGTSISRNSNLLQGQTINPDFVYNTPLSLFPTRISPLISETNLIEMAGDTFAEAVSNLFKNLTAAQNAISPDTLRQFRITAAYWIAADGTTDPSKTPLSYKNPLLLTPIYAFDVSTDWQSGKFTDKLTTEIQLQASAMGITPSASGRWVIDVLVYSYQDQSQIESGQPPTPLLDIQNQVYSGGGGVNRAPLEIRATQYNVRDFTRRLL